jgi:predicted metal-dependent phosphoesterase TrpH
MYNEPKDLGSDIIDRRYIDLHTHTTCSDGQLTPQGLIDLAENVGLTALAITDHDVVDGIKTARDHSKKVEVISGVELSACEGTSDIHILGYFIDPTHKGLEVHLSEFRAHRYDRARQIVKKLNELGVDLSFENVLACRHDEKTSIGRPHIARALLDAGLVKSTQMAFKLYLGNRASAYIPKSKISVLDAIQIIKDAGGLSVMAHPGSTRRDELIPQFAEAGLDGLEVFHREHNEVAQRYYSQISEKNKLFKTGGSDFHGARPNRPGLGSMKVEYHHLDLMRNRLKLIQ